MRRWLAFDHDYVRRLLVTCVGWWWCSGGGAAEALKFFESVRYFLQTSGTSTPKIKSRGQKRENDAAKHTDILILFYFILSINSVLTQILDSVCHLSLMLLMKRKSCTTTTGLPPTNHVKQTYIKIQGTS